jgi:hypothetical protein
MPVSCFSMRLHRITICVYSASCDLNHAGELTELVKRLSGA